MNATTSRTLPSRVLITGASGLLGTAIVDDLSAATDVLPLAHSRPFPGMRRIDLSDPAETAGLADERWDAAVHCVAYRSPDFCEENREAANRLNVGAAARLAAIANRKSARFIHISTDYVFDGRHPPYREDDPPCPVNYYGETKRMAEEQVRDACPGAVVLRIPALYGDPPAPVVSAMVEEGVQAAFSGETSRQDHRIIRCPTYTGDVARVIRFLFTADFEGTLHAPAEETATRYEWALAFAAILGRDASHIVPVKKDPKRKAPRPPDSRLARDRLKKLGGPLPRDYSEVVPRILAHRLG
jgi:dTDP-4-dehydrorhamnose reductase